MTSIADLKILQDELSDASAVLRYNEAPGCADAVDQAISLLKAIAQTGDQEIVRRAIFHHPLMQAVERCASTRWLSPSEQVAVAGTVLKLLAIPRRSTSEGDL